MKEETTIVLELTPREASAIWEMAHTYSWSDGPYGDEVLQIARALDRVRMLLNPDLDSVGTYGKVLPGAIWLMDV